jgi:Chalcone isomerase-like
MHRRPSIRAHARRITGVVLLAGTAAAGLASEARGPALPPEAARAYPTLSAAGAGTLRWFGFHLYDARLWTERERPGADRPFVLALRYARDFEGRSIARRSIDEIARLGFGTAPDRARWLAAMQDIFPDVTDGQELAGLNVPGGGVRFYLDGRAIGAIADSEFAQAFFAIWLDPRTQAPALRTALLRGTKRVQP